MPKFATKAADNMFCQARYEAAKFNERLSSREGAAEELGVDRTRLARIELGSVTPYPEEVLLMADIYRAPELKGNYCREMCPLGKGMPKIESHQDIDRISYCVSTFVLAVCNGWIRQGHSVTWAN